MATGKDGGGDLGSFRARQFRRECRHRASAAGQRGRLLQADTPDERVCMPMRKPPFRVRPSDAPLSRQNCMLILMKLMIRLQEYAE
ncbi:hypothetical protein [Mesorhizobium muleiense]|uniref:hypothetical protein n=1 Tax=Mesorhizobium muleiense TaxID=1004279 RepID=UPI001F35910E|nr:hypothetical protein [Mesorhizobium muleiense]MCF6113811.1 hypothetical protein [Mesorhizobium muleiense]